ncbi:hypothetical protein ACTFIU_010710 [Dictyostelium citrinum]
MGFDNKNNIINSLFPEEESTTFAQVVRGIAISSDDYLKNDNIPKINNNNSNSNNSNSNDYFNGRYNLVHSSVSIPSFDSFNFNSINSNGSNSGNSSSSNGRDEENERLRSEYKKIIKNNASKLELTRSKSRILVINSNSGEEEEEIPNESDSDNNSNNNNKKNSINKKLKNGDIVLSKSKSIIDTIDAMELVDSCGM